MPPIRVLVVDDEPIIRQSLFEYLTDFNFKTSIAEDAEQALEVLKEASFDVAIIDLRLPGMGGEALIIKAHKIQPSLRFLIHTGSLDYNRVDELKRIGIRPEHVLLKPLPDMRLLVKCISDLVHE